MGWQPPGRLRSARGFRRSASPASCMRRGLLVYSITKPRVWCEYRQGVRILLAPYSAVRLVRRTGRRPRLPFNAERWAEGDVSVLGISRGQAPDAGASPHPLYLNSRCNGDERDAPRYFDGFRARRVLPLMQLHEPPQLSSHCRPTVKVDWTEVGASDRATPPTEQHLGRGWRGRSFLLRCWGEGRWRAPREGVRATGCARVLLAGQDIQVGARIGSRTIRAIRTGWWVVWSRRRRCGRPRGPHPVPHR